MQMFLLHRNASCVHWDAADDCPVDWTLTSQPAMHPGADSVLATLI